MGRFKEEIEMKGTLRRKSGARHGVAWPGGHEESPSSRRPALVVRPVSVLGG